MLKATVSTLLTGLYAVYKGESNANDSLGAYNGTVQGGLTYGTGKSGNAFVGNGTTGYVKLPTGAFNSLTGDFSVSGWVSLRSGYTGSDTEVIFNNMSATSWLNAPGGFWFILFGDLIQVRIGDKSSGVGVILSYTLGVQMPSANAFVHFVATRKAGTRTRIYYNGNLLTSDTNTINPVYYTTGVNTTTPSIGSVQFPNGVQSDYFLPNGSKIDEVNVWNKELTATEVTELYNSGAGKFYPTF
jgi:hypothetical protein